MQTARDRQRQTETCRGWQRYRYADRVCQSQTAAEWHRDDRQRQTRRGNHRELHREMQRLTEAYRDKQREAGRCTQRQREETAAGRDIE